MKNTMQLIQTSIDTPLGRLVAICDESFLYILKFIDDKHLDREIKNIQQRTSSSIITATNHLTDKLNQEIDAYFAGALQEFSIPFKLYGSQFQQKSWHSLQTIAYGTTASYAQQAALIACLNGHRAVANANGKNPIIIIIPCHRIINTNGKLGGYTSGLDRKKMLLALEKEYLLNSIL